MTSTTERTARTSTRGASRSASPEPPASPVPAGSAQPPLGHLPRAAPVPRARPGEQPSRDAPGEAADAQLALVRLLLEAGDFRHAATALCTRLALDLGAARASVGWRRGDGCRAVAVSGAAVETLDDDARRLIQAAMDEALDQGVACWSPDPDGARRIAHAQQRLHRSHGGSAITAPLAHRGRRLGALTLEFESPHATGAALARRCESVVDVVAPILAALHARDEAGWLERRRAAASARGAPAGSRSGWRWATAAAAVLLVGLATVPVDLTVSAQARVEGEVQRVVSAPSHGYLKAVRARPGDAVRAGDVLAELGARDLELERDKLRSELAQHRGAADAAFARGDRPAMAVARSKADEAQAQLDLIAQQLTRSVLLAPIDGVLIQGDHWQSLDAPVERGQPLFTLAPADRWRIIIELDERDLAQAKVGQRGRLSLSAMPWDALPLEVVRIAPMAAALDGRNVFELEARLDGAPADLRPGLRGIARLDTRDRPLLALWGERLAQALHRAAWRWLP